jgi:hypothetical protein
MKELWHGYFATRIYLPLSGLSRRWRRLRGEIRGKSDRFLQKTRLPEVSWRDCTKRRAIRIWEPKKENGNVRISELGILAAFAADCRNGSNLFEIGTFDGRTTLNLALNSPPRCTIYTLDLPPDLGTLFPLAEGERHMVTKPKPGARYERHRKTNPAAIGKIHQLLGDSATLDYSPFKDSCSLVFVDGSHQYETVMSDSRAAMGMAHAGGVVVWHDYGVWEGVTNALETLEQRERCGLRNISGTSLVYWKKS